jgi:methylase of polypeptide subunit release factors
MLLPDEFQLQVLVWKLELRNQPLIEQETEDVILNLKLRYSREFPLQVNLGSKSFFFPHLYLNEFAHDPQSDWQVVDVLEDAVDDDVDERLQFLNAAIEDSLNFGAMLHFGSVLMTSWNQMGRNAITYNNLRTA